MAGVMLGTAALGNLLQSYSEEMRLVCGALAAVMLVLLILKMIVCPNMLKEEMKNPIMASIAATFSMGLMLLSVYAKPYIGGAAIYVWYLAILIHILIIINFTVRFIFKFDIKKVFASYFIPYVGLAVIGITAPAYEKINLGTMAFMFAFVCLLVLLAVVGYRYLKYTELPPPAQPLLCIFTAPASLCLAGYISSVESKSKGLIIFMAILASVLYIVVLTQLPKYLKLPFFPSYASFTFPFVISAIGMKQTMNCLANMGSPAAWLQYVVLIETIIAVVLVVYTIIRYCMYLVTPPKAA